MPLICPQPGPRGPGRSCPLYDYRLALQQDAALRRAVLNSPPTRPDLAALISSEPPRPTRPEPGRPVLPRPVLPLPLHMSQKGAPHD
jgi:hypothetical protein